MFDFFVFKFWLFLVCATIFTFLVISSAKTFVVVKEKFEISNLFRKDGQIIVRVVTQKRPEGYNEIREAAPTLEDVYLYEFEVKGAMHK